VNADPREIVWTSGATESDNLAIKGAANFYSGKGKHIITVATEHKAVIDPVRELERQGFTGKVKIDLEKLPVDLMSFSAHKTYGPKGIGALYVRRKPRVRIEAQMHGGGHERGMRSGTLAPHQIVGMGEAFRIARLEMAEENARIRTLHDRLLDGLQKIEETYVNGDLTKRVFSIGRFTTEADVDYTINLLEEKIGKLRELSPLWEMFKDGIDISKVEWAEH